MLRLVLLGSVLGLALGCNGPSPPDPSDAEVGRGLLQNALDGWKRGDTMDAYQSSSSVVVVDPAWKKGGKLKDFEIQSDTTHSGLDVQFKVKLNVQDNGGAAKTQKVMFLVCTTPRKVVMRGEGGW